MKSIKREKRLVFNKETIVNLLEVDMDTLRGGTTGTTVFTEFNTCLPTCPPSQPVDCPPTYRIECF